VNKAVAAPKTMLNKEQGDDANHDRQYAAPGSAQQQSPGGHQADDSPNQHQCADNGWHRILDFTKLISFELPNVNSLSVELRDSITA
jgi:hypothetical protein